MSAAGLRLALVGSAMFQRRLRTEPDPGLHELLAVVREADAAFLNLEAPIYEPRAYPVKQYMFSSYVTAEPWLAEELAWAGFGLVSLANNHMADWSPESVVTNRALFEAAGVVTAGAGPTLADARAPGYLDTPHGRVALLCVDSSFEYGEFTQVQMASDPHGGVRGRPGVNGLRFDTTYELDDECFEALAKAHRALGLHREGLEIAYRNPPGPDRFLHHGIAVQRSERNRVATRCRPGDLAEIERWIATARAQADCVIVSHHTHAASGARWELPADFAADFAHAAVDAGADVYVGHGYTLKGVELYRGKPILHDVGNFSAQDASARRHPHDAYVNWGLGRDATPGDFADARDRARREAQGSRDDDAMETLAAGFAGGVLVTAAFDGDGLRELVLHPTGIRHDPRRHRRGTPYPARGELAARVLGRVVEASESYGTQIDVSGDRATVRLP